MQYNSIIFQGSSYRRKYDRHKSDDVITTMTFAAQLCDEAATLWYGLDLYPGLHKILKSKNGCIY
jgi:hypothetical protein